MSFHAEQTKLLVEHQAKDQLYFMTELITEGFNKQSAIITGTILYGIWNIDVEKQFQYALSSNFIIVKRQ